MKKLALLCLFFVLPAIHAQQFNPAQIRAGSNGQCLVTVAGVTTWTTCPGGGGGTPGGSNHSMQFNSSSSFAGTAFNGIPVLSTTADPRVAVYTDITGLWTSCGSLFLKGDGTCANPAGAGTVTSVAVSGGTTGLTTSGGPITGSGTITLGGTLAVANGGTGTSSPGIVAGTNVTVTGTWPNQTVNSTGGGGTPFGSSPGIPYALTSSTSRAATVGDLNALYGYVPAQAATLIGSPLVRYDMLHVSGATLTDSSGNGNNGTLAGSPIPTATSTGLNFTAVGSFVTMPSGVNAARSFLHTFFVTPTMAVTLAQVSGNPWMITSSLGTASFNFTAAGLNYGVAQYAAGTWATACYALESGFHTYGVTLGTGGGDLDHIYIDGNECGAYQSQGSSAGLQTSGNYFLGDGGTFGGSSVKGQDYWFEAFAAELTAAQMLSESTSLNSIVAARGVQTGPLPLNLGLAQITVGIDSITAGTGSTGGNTGWPTRLSLVNQPSYNVVNFGIPGDKLLRAALDVAYRDAPQCSSTQGPNIWIIDGGSNDIQPITGNTPAQAYGYLVAYSQILKRAGCRVYWGTMISRTGTGYDANKNAYDALQRMGWKAAGIDGIIDFASIVCLGADGAFGSACNSGDGVHPNNTGYQAMGDAASRKLNYDFGYSASNPHVLAATGAYAMTAADGAIDIPTASVTSPLTLPSCIGQSYSVYSISNQQSLSAVTVVGNAGTEPINGLTSAFTIPGNNTVLLTDVPNDTTVAGCHWDAVVVPVAGGGAPAFSAITTGTSTGTPMVVGNGSSIDYTGTGTIDANRVNAATVPTTGGPTTTNAAGQVIQPHYINSLTAAMDSYGLGTGVSNPLIYGILAWMSRATPAPTQQYSVGGQSTGGNLAPYIQWIWDPNVPSVMLANGIENDAPFDACGATVGTNCYNNFVNIVRSQATFVGVPYQNRQYASVSTGTTGTWTTDSSISFYAPTLTTAPGTGMKSSVSGSTRTFTLATGLSVTKVGIMYPVTNAGAGTFTVTVDGSSVTDGCGNATFSSGPCGGQALIGASSGTEFTAEFTVGSVLTHTIVVTTTNASNSGINSAYWITPTPSANSNAYYFIGAPALAAWTNYALYNTAAQNVLTAERANGLYTYYVDTTGLPAADFATSRTATCALATVGNHPNTCGTFDIANLILAAQSAAGGFQFASPNLGGPAASQGAISSNIQATVFGNSFLTASHQFNATQVTTGTNLCGFLSPTAANAWCFSYLKDLSSGKVWSNQNSAVLMGSAGFALFSLYDGSGSAGATHITAHAGVKLSTGDIYTDAGITAGLMPQGTVNPTLASATTIAPTTPYAIVTGTTTISTITPPTGTGATGGAVFDFVTSGVLTITTGGNIASPAITTVANTPYRCIFMGTTNGNWYCK